MATFSNKGKGLRSGALWPAMRKCLTEHLGRDNNCTKDSGLLRGMEDYGIYVVITLHTFHLHLLSPPRAFHCSSRARACTQRRTE